MHAFFLSLAGDRNSIASAYNTFCILLVCVFVTVFTVGCESRALTKAQGLHTVGAYDAFLREYPDGKLRQQALSLRETAYFNDVKAENSIQSYQRYLHEYPHGRHASFADSVVRVREALLKDLQSSRLYDQVLILATLASGSTAPSAAHTSSASSALQTSQDCRDLAACIMKSPSLDSQEQQYWLAALDVMTPDQTAELRDILESETRHTARQQESRLWRAAIGKDELVAIRHDPAFSEYFNRFDSLYMTSMDIVVTYTRIGDCSSIPFLGELCDEELYAGEVKKNDVVYKAGDYIRTVHSENDLAEIDTTPGASSKNWHSKLLGKEAFGSVRDFLARSGNAGDLFHKNYSVSFADSYIPTQLSKTSTSASGGILGFIQDNPITSLVVGTVVYTAAHALKNSPRTSSSSASSGAADSCSAECPLLTGVCSALPDRNDRPLSSPQSRCKDDAYSEQTSCLINCERR